MGRNVCQLTVVAVGAWLGIDVGGGYKGKAGKLLKICAVELGFIW